MKRAFDILASSAGLAVLLPFMLLVAIAVRLTSGSPILFRQERMGRGYRPFTMLKFRTMVVDAPRLGEQITKAGDARVTHIGRLLRKLKLDELPQLVNVLKGDMSIVGPRPEVPRFVDMFEEDYRFILSVRPGLTDPASLKYWDESEVLAQYTNPMDAYTAKILPDKITIAKSYVNQSSMLSDMGVILQTARAIVQSRKATSKVRAA
jgi:lipopolysaccharide/colanic/teichoic acid biosynthesis glycosyltransferase